MKIYYSRHANLQIDLGKGFKVIEFKNQSGSGIYKTNNEKEIKALELNPYFNSSLTGGFFSKSIGIDPEIDVITGVRGAAHNEINETKEQEMKELKELFKEYYELKSAILKKDGNYKFNVSEESKKRFEELSELI